MSFAPSRRESLTQKRRSSPPRCQPVLRRAKRGNMYLQPGVPSRGACLFSSLHFGLLCAVRPLCVTVGFPWPRSEREDLGQRCASTQRAVRKGVGSPKGPAGTRWSPVNFETWSVSLCGTGTFSGCPLPPFVLQRECHPMEYSPEPRLPAVWCVGGSVRLHTLWKAVFCGASCWVSCQPCQGRRDGCRGILAKMSRWMRGVPRSTAL